jgi:hypothetical protein
MSLNTTVSADGTVEKIPTINLPKIFLHPGQLQQQLPFGLHSAHPGQLTGLQHPEVLRAQVTFSLISSNHLAFYKTKL